MQTLHLKVLRVAALAGLVAFPSGAFAQATDYQLFYNVSGSGNTLEIQATDRGNLTNRDEIVKGKAVTAGRDQLMTDPTSNLVDWVAMNKYREIALLADSASLSASERAELISILTELNASYALAEKKSTQNACEILNNNNSNSDEGQLLELAWNELPTGEVLLAVRSELNEGFLPKVRESMGEDAWQKVLVLMDQIPTSPLGATTREFAERIGADKREMLDANCKFIPQRGW